MRLFWLPNTVIVTDRACIKFQPSRLTDVVLVGVVECVDDGRLCGPLVGVDALAQLVHVALGLEAEDAEEVLQERLGVDHQLREGGMEKF